MRTRPVFSLAVQTSGAASFVAGQLRRALSAQGKTGLSAIGELPALLTTACPEAGGDPPIVGCSKRVSKLTRGRMRKRFASKGSSCAEAKPRQRLPPCCRRDERRHPRVCGADFPSPFLAPASWPAPSHLRWEFSPWRLAQGAAYFGRHFARDQGRIAARQASRGEAEMARLTLYPRWPRRPRRRFLSLSTALPSFCATS